MKLRRRAVAKWAGAAAALVVAAGWIASGPLWITLAWIRPDEDFSLTMQSGSLGFERNFYFWKHKPGLTLEVHRIPRAARGPWEWLPSKGPDYSCRAGYGHITIPLWWPMTICAVSSAALFYDDRRSRRWTREGRCVGCGYDLSGASGKCPECGRGVT